MVNMGCIFILPPNDRDHPTETCEALMLEKTRLDSCSSRTSTLKLGISKIATLCGYTSDCATHEKGKNYHESTKD